MAAEAGLGRYVRSACIYCYVLTLTAAWAGRGKSREVRSAFVCAADNSSFPLYHTLGRVEFVVISILPPPDRFSPFPMDGASSPAAALVDTLKGVAVSAVAANVLGELWYIAGRDLRATRLVRAAAPYIGASW